MNGKFLLSIAVILVLTFGIFFVSASHDKDMENEYQTSKLGGSSNYVPVQSQVQNTNTQQNQLTNVPTTDKQVVNTYVQPVINNNVPAQSPCNSITNSCNQPPQVQYVQSYNYNYNQPSTACNPSVSDCQPIPQERNVPCQNNIDQEKGVPCYATIPQTKKYCRNPVVDSCGNVKYSDDSCEDSPIQEKGDGDLVTPMQTSVVPCSNAIAQDKDTRACYYD